MKKKTSALLLILTVLALSVLVTILPSFYTKGVSRVELKQDLDLELVLDKSHDIELVFFGYAGCADICTPRLQDLGRWYSTLPQKFQKRMTLKFLDLSTPEDKGVPDVFAKAFHQNFQGVFLDDHILRVYTKAFSVYFSPSLMDENEMDHTAHLYLLKRDKEGKELRFIYTAYPYDFRQIQSDIKALIRE